MKNFIIFVLSLLFCSSVWAKDFCITALKQAANPTFKLKDYAGQASYYDLVYDKIAAAIANAGAGPSSTNETKLRDGEGVSVELDQKNYNVHINFPKSEMGGRSYGWTDGKVGDWSDTMYLQNAAQEMDQKRKVEIASFYKVIIDILGASNSAGLEKLAPETQRVATNFLAILTAEQYRRIQNKNTHWDDALIQVTLLAAFHGGQSAFHMYYTGDFTDTTKVKGPGVYANGHPGKLADKAKDKSADMTDYHQFSGKLPDEQGSNRSGINLTRNDFEKMGQAISEYEKDNVNLKTIYKIIGKKSDNVYADLAGYFTEGRAKAGDADALASAVGKFMIDTYADADDITKSLK